MPNRSSVIVFHIDGQEESIDLYDIDGIEWRDMKRATGLKQNEIVPLALREQDFEAVAALLWVSRRRLNPGLRYLDVLKSLSVGAYYGPDDDEEEESSSIANGSAPTSESNGRISPASMASAPGKPTS